MLEINIFAMIRRKLKNLNGLNTSLYYFASGHEDEKISKFLVIVKNLGDYRPLCPTVKIFSGIKGEVGTRFSIPFNSHLFNSFYLGHR